MPDATQLLNYLVLLRLQLQLVRKMLPFATAAKSEMLAERLYPILAERTELNHLCLTIRTLLLDYP